MTQFCDIAVKPSSVVSVGPNLDHPTDLGHRHSVFFDALKFEEISPHHHMVSQLSQLSQRQGWFR